MRTVMIRTLLVFSALLVVACTPKRPVLYPNAYLQKVGQTQAEQDIEACIQMANDYKAGGDRTKEIAMDTGKAAVVGAATGAVVGAISGDAGVGAAIGAAGAGTAALGYGLFHSAEPDPIFKQFVDKCLQDKGFQVIGWR